MISVYLSNNNVQIVVGTGKKNKIEVKQFYSAYIAEGSIINGVITNEVELAEEIRNLWEKYQLPKRQVGLVIDSTQFISRTTDMPNLNARMSSDMIRREFADVEERQDPLYDYMVLGEAADTKMRQVLGATVDRSFIGGFVKLFEQIGISVTSVDLSLCSAIGLFALHPVLKNKTCIIQVLDGDNLVSFLLLNGKYKYSNRSRLFGEHGSPEFGVEIGRHVSSIMQFNASEKSVYEITDVYFGGFAPEDLTVCMDSVRTLNLEVQVLPNTKNITLHNGIKKEQAFLSDYIYAVGNLLLRGMNFYTQFQRDPQQEEKNKKRKVILLPMGIGLLVMAIAGGTLIVSNQMLQRERNELKKYMKQPLRVEQYQRSLQLEQQNNELIYQIENDTLALEVLQSYPKPNSQVWDAVNACAAGQVGIMVDSYVAETGIYSFEATADHVTEINQFIARLEQVKDFAKVEYTGYQFLDEKQVYNILVSCYLSETAGK